MPKQTRPDDQKDPWPNEAGNKEPAEGSRESSPGTSDADERESVTHDRQSHVINRDAEDDVMPTSDSTLRTKI